MKKLAEQKPDECMKKLMAIKDAMDILSGKWKIQIVGSLNMRGKMRFMDLMREVDGIAAKMLSKELVNLETNLLVKRTVLNTRPVTVEYELTTHGKTLDNVISGIAQWGLQHRKKVTGRK